MDLAQRLEQLQARWNDKSKGGFAAAEPLLRKWQQGFDQRPLVDGAAAVAERLRAELEADGYLDTQSVPLGDRHEAQDLVIVRSILSTAAKLPLHRRHELLDAVSTLLGLTSLFNCKAAANADGGAPAASAHQPSWTQPRKPYDGAPLLLPQLSEIEPTLESLWRNVADSDTPPPSPRGVPVQATCSGTAAAVEAAAAPKAAAKRADALTLSLVPEYDQYGVASGETLRAVVSIKAAPEASRRAHVALTCVLDRSGSMYGQPMELVRDTAHFLIDQLTSDDYLGLISYSSAVREDLPLMRMTPQAKALAHRVVGALEADGGTALYDGLEAGIRQQLEAEEELGRRWEEDASQEAPTLVHSCFLFTDGEATEGPETTKEILAGMRALQAPSGRVVTMHKFGFGEDHSVELLQAVADAQSGVYYYIAGSEDIAGGFGDALGGLLAVVAKDIRLTVRPGPGTSLAAFRSGGRAIGGDATGGTAPGRADPSRHGATVKWPCEAPNAEGAAFNDMFAEETRECLLFLNLPAAVTSEAAARGDEAMTVAAVAQVELEYTDMASGARVWRMATLQVARSAEPRPVGQLPAELVVLTAARFETLDAVEKAQAAVAGGNAGDVLSYLDQRLNRLAAAPLRTAARAALAEELSQMDKAAIASTVQALRQQRVGAASEAMASRHSALNFACKSAYRQQASVAVSRMVEQEEYAEVYE
ncbi:hypothetical protein GPECTOR_30g223 [Gonium pectorale]|uniref:VWFA domain-containing protein n=1 Tax=Gonium pectorale TaxID=33097 RepID=A0A150GE55_GONPE|nr:hypothetical protein GPECTOR_30g223 [Gonium pectorale]|eukprot:KXZ48127.1 hypothetical protein GPECTOR_30g223 [Gonium pectorale]